MPEEATSRRVEGPTPRGGAYSIGHFQHDGRPVPQRFANQLVIVEYDADDREIARTIGTCTPQEILPRDFEAPVAAPDALAQLAAGLGRVRAAPRTRRVAQGPPAATQAACLARAYMVGDAAFA